MYSQVHERFLWLNSGFILIVEIFCFYVFSPSKSNFLWISYRWLDRNNEYKLTYYDVRTSPRPLLQFAKDLIKV